MQMERMPTAIGISPLLRIVAVVVRNTAAGLLVISFYRDSNGANISRLHLGKAVEEFCEHVQMQTVGGVTKLFCGH